MNIYSNYLIAVNPQTLLVSGQPMTAPPVPFNGLALSTLVDLGLAFPGQSFEIDGIETSVDGLGYWPITTVDSSAVILGQTVASGSDTFTANAETQTVTQHLGAQAMTTEQIAVYNQQNAQSWFTAFIGKGMAVTSTGTPALNAIYDITSSSEVAWTASESAVSAGVFRGYFRDINGIKIIMTAAQFTEIAAAAYNIIVEAEDALVASFGGAAWSPPSNTIAIA